MPRQHLNSKLVEEALIEFVARTDALTDKAWKASSPPFSSTSAAKYMPGGNFSEVAIQVALQHGPPDRTYTWPICPQGQRHPDRPPYKGTTSAYVSAECTYCSESQAQKAAYEDSLPTFEERYPHLVPYLMNPEDRLSRRAVAFRCSTCQQGQVPWSPSRGGKPLCIWCQAREGRQPGDLIPRQGGGGYVQFDSSLATELCILGLEVSTDDGVVLGRGTYVAPVLKPDLVLPQLLVAVEVDNSVGRQCLNRHDTPEGQNDDQTRDTLLEQLGWKVLRIRRPDQLVVGAWPWRIETTSKSPKKVARLVHEELTRTQTAVCTMV